MANQVDRGHAPGCDGLPCECGGPASTEAWAEAVRKVRAELEAEQESHLKVSRALANAIAEREKFTKDFEHAHACHLRSEQDADALAGALDWLVNDRPGDGLKNAQQCLAAHEARVKGGAP